MKRSPLKRKTWMRRTRTLSVARKKSAYKLRVRDTEYMLWIKQQRCCARHSSDCDGPVEADHAGRRPTGRKSGDRSCIPLCTLHHMQRGSFSGVFRTWNQAMMRAWLEGHVLAYRAQFEQEMRMATTTKRFFKLDDDGAFYYMVAVDEVHAKRLLDGVEFGYPSKPFEEAVDSDGDPLKLVELDADQAAKLMVAIEDGTHGARTPLTHIAVGNYFCTEY